MTREEETIYNRSQKVKIEFLSINTVVKGIVREIEVEKRQKFTLSLLDSTGKNLKFFANNDEVLSISEKDNVATIKCDNVGESIIQIESQGQELFELKVTVIKERAVSLCLKAESPEKK